VKKILARVTAGELASEPTEAAPTGALPYSAQRKRHIARLEAARQAWTLVYINRGIHPPDTLLRYLLEHLRSGRTRTHDRIALVVYNGSQRSEVEDVHAELNHALRVIALLREHTRELEVFVPADAYGIGTYLCLGADRIFVHPLGSLGRLAAADALAPARHFLRLLADAGISEPAVQAQVMTKLVEEVGAQRLGVARYAISRLNSGIRELVGGRVHRRQEAQNQALFEALLDSSCPLAHPIDRRRAKDVLALPVESLDPELENTLWEIFNGYEHPMRLHSPIEPDVSPPDIVLESDQLCHCHIPVQAGSKRSGALTTDWVRVVSTEVQ